MKDKSFSKFTILWIGQLVSILGSGLTSFGLGVWLYTQNQQVTPLALTILFATLPHLILAPFSGYLADKVNKKWVMLIMDSGTAFFTLILLILFRTGNLSPWMIYTVAFINATFGVFQAPALQASTVLLVPKESLKRASGLNQISGALQTLVTPLLAGLLYSIIGLGGLFIIDFITFFIAIFLLYLLPSRLFVNEIREKEDMKKVPLRKKVMEGYSFIFQRKGLLALLIFFAVVNFFLNISMVLLTPLVLSFNGTIALGSVQMAGGAGMLIGSLVATVTKKQKHLMRNIYIAILFAALNLIVMGARESVFLIGLGRFLFLFAVPIANTSAVVLWQLKGPTYLQGRLFAARQMMVRAVVPLAYLLVGPLVDGLQLNGAGSVILGEGIGATYRLIMMVSGMILSIMTVTLLMYKPMRNLEKELPDYEEKVA